jgi:protein arginine kinase activator
MICQNCQKNAATVHVTEIVEPSPASGEPGAETEKPQVQEQHLCEVCAQTMDLPHMPAVKKTMADIWKLLQISAQQTRKKGGPVCPECGMTLDEFRKKGRLGCAKDYEVFQAHILELLERVHGSRVHVGRIPGTSEEEVERQRRMHALRHELEVAIREEAYESAARLRDELKGLEERKSHS